MTDTLGKNTSETNKLSKNVSKQSWTSFDTSSDDGLSTKPVALTPNPTAKPVAHPPLSERLGSDSKSEGLGVAQHTPGPWVLDDKGAIRKTHLVDITSKDKRGNWVVTHQERQPYGIPIVSSIPFLDTKSVQKANAQLIAQAPTLKAENEALKALNAELVEALSQLVYSGTNKLCVTLPSFINTEIIEAVIAKAKGVQA